MPPKLSKCSYDINFKLEAVDFASKNSGEAAGRKFGVAPSCIRNWIKKKSELMELQGSQRRRLKGGGRRKASSSNPQLDCTQRTNISKYKTRLSTKISESESILPLDPYPNSKQIVDELQNLLGNCQANCSNCEKLIVKLSQHIRTAHCTLSALSQSQEETHILSTTLSEIKVEVEDDIDIDYFDDTEQFDESSFVSGSNVTDTTPVCPSVSTSRVCNTFKIYNYGFEFENEDQNKDDHDGNLVSKSKSADYKSLEGSETKYKPKQRKSKYSGDNPQDCVICGKKFANPKRLGEHCRKGHKQETTSSSSFPTCSICPLLFPNQRYLTHHLKVFHNAVDPIAESRSYDCYICKINFPSHGTLCTHFEQQHPLRKPYVCQFCQKEYDVECNFKYHLRIHTGEKPFACAVCQKTFRLNFELKHHMEKVHSTEIPVFQVCKICGSGFRTKKQLIVHGRTRHGEEKPFMCELCSKCFATKVHLKTHMLYHKGVRSYICKFCNKGFITIYNLKFHEKQMHTGKKEIVCHICGKLFQWRSVLKKHLASHSK